MHRLEGSVLSKGNSKHKGFEMKTRLFCLRNRKFCGSNGPAVKEVSKVGRYGRTEAQRMQRYCTVTCN